jgi:hypothetical protein
MRIWSLHPKYLDRMGLLACWREALLAQKVLQGGTRGYRNHPQITRFQRSPDPALAIAAYLDGIAGEAEQRGYSFNRGKIASSPHAVLQLSVTRGQVLYEWEHLKAKLIQRDPQRLLTFSTLEIPDVHPLFQLVDGGVEPWEKVPVQAEHTPQGIGKSV